MLIHENVSISNRFHICFNSHDLFHRNLYIRTYILHLCMGNPDAFSVCIKYLGFHIMLIYKFKILFLGSVTRHLHDLIFKNTLFFSHCTLQQYFCLKHSFFSSCLFESKKAKSALIGQHVHSFVMG